MIRVFTLAILLLTAAESLSVEPDTGFRVNLKFHENAKEVWDLDAIHLADQEQWVIKGGISTNDNKLQGFFAFLGQEEQVTKSGQLPSDINSFSQLLPLPDGKSVFGWAVNKEGTGLDLGIYDTNSLATARVNHIEIQAATYINAKAESDGNSLILINADKRLYLIKIDREGDAIWIKDIDSVFYSSDQFEQFNITESYITPNGYALTILQFGSKIIDESFVDTYKLLLVNLSKSGELLWSKTFETEGLFPQVNIDSNGNFYVVATKETNNQEGNYPEYTRILKLDSSGSEAWSTQIDGVTCSFSGALQDGGVILQNSDEAIIANNRAQYVILGPDGLSAKGVEIIYSELGGFAFEKNNRLWFNIDSFRLNAPSLGSRKSPVVGWISADLRESRWIRYTRETAFSRLIPNSKNNRFLFIASLFEVAEIDCIEIDSYFDEGSSDGLFEIANIDVNTIPFDAKSVDWSMESFNLPLPEGSLQFNESDLALRTYDFKTAKLRETFDKRVPIENRRRHIDILDGNLVLQLPTKKGVNYLIEASDKIQPGTWSKLDEFVGTGYQEYIVQRLWNSGKIGFIRISESREN